MGQGLDNVRNIYLEGIAGGKAREAVHAYTGHRYTQHSTGVGDGPEGFLEFFEPFVERNPKRDIEITRIFEDGRWVFCSAYQSLNDGAAKWVTMDMFYTDADGLILEHWDTIAPYVSETAAGTDMIGGARDVDFEADTETNKAIVLEYTKQVRQQGEFGKLDQFVADNIVQHAPTIGAGRAGLAAHAGPRRRAPRGRADRHHAHAPAAGADARSRDVELPQRDARALHRPRRLAWRARASRRDRLDPDGAPGG